MSSTTTNHKFSFPNMVLIAGNGRNVGKTALACKIIEHLSEDNSVTGLKISPHFHPYETQDVFIESESFVILREKNKTGKDSSLMLQAGARKVFYMMARQESLKDALNALIPYLTSGPIICESGGLHEFVQPGLFFFVNYNNREIEKQQLLQYNPQKVENDGKNFTIKIERLTFSGNQIHI